MATEPPAVPPLADCESVTEDYFRALERGNKLAPQVKARCAALKVAQAMFRDAFLLWAALFALAVACVQYGLFGEMVCEMLWALAAAATALVMVLFFVVFARARGLTDLQNQCEMAKAEATLAVLKSFILCPPGSRLDFPRFDCGCS